MKTRMFYTNGNQDICETEWDKPEPKADQIEVRNIITGVCRSDIDMYTGQFHLPSIYMQGHEGLGEVTKVGRDLKNLVREGSIVATRGEPSFADYYNADIYTFVEVPAADPKYIIEPVACAINIYKSLPSGMPVREQGIVILGTGFLATVLYETMRDDCCENNVTVIGNANVDYWKEQDVDWYGSRNDLPSDTTFDIIFDLSDKKDFLECLLPINNESIIVLAAEKHPQAILPMSELLWKAATIIFPSPRNSSFIDSMELAVDLIEEGVIDTQSMWTRGYDRDTEVKAAFEDGLHRTAGYQRGYIRW